MLRVVAVAERRGPPAAALTLYEDLTPKEAPAGDSGLTRPVREHGPRPTKRDRRRLDAFRTGES